MNLNEDKFYIKVVALNAIYNFVLKSFLFKIVTKFNFKF